MNIIKDEAEKSRQRVEAWWNHEIIDRAVIKVTAPAGKPAAPEAEVNGGFESHFTDPDVVIPLAESRLARTYFGGEAFPVAPGVPKVLSPSPPVSSAALSNFSTQKQYGVNRSSTIPLSFLT